MNKRAVLYSRVSGDDRDNDGRNLAGQLTMGREYCQNRGYQVIAELQESDKGASGADIDLPQLNKVREMARAGLYDVLIVRELDRLSRNLAKQLTVEEELTRRGVVIEYVLYDYPDTAEGRLMKNIRGSFAEFEREKIRERVLRGKRNKVASGSFVGTDAPYGYRKNQTDKKTTLIVQPTEAAVVKQIFTWFGAENVPIRDIKRRLDSIDAPKPVNSGRQRAGGWPRSTIYNILRASTYYGEWAYTYDCQERLTVEIPAIISHKLWAAASERLASNKEKRTRATKYSYLMTRRLVCASCGRIMVSETQKRPNGKTHGYYRCPGDNEGKKCPGMRVAVKDVDPIVENWITEIVLNPENVEERIAVFQEQAQQQNAPVIEQLAITDEMLKDNREKMSKLIDLYTAGIYTLEEIAERKARHTQTIESLEKQRAELAQALEGKTFSPAELADIREVVTMLARRLENPTFERVAAIVQGLRVSGRLALLEDGRKELALTCYLKTDTITINATEKCLNDVNSNGVFITAVFYL